MRRSVFLLAIILAGSLASGVPSDVGAISFLSSSDGTFLANSLLGSGVSLVGAGSYTGVANQSGTFTGGVGSGVGFATGVILTSGNINTIPGGNNPAIETRSSGAVGASDDVSTNLNRPGYAPLSALSGFSTYDAAILEFDFQFGDGSTGGDLYFNFVFGSEEYINFVNTQFNDVFGFFVDGVNVGLVPGTTSPITINTVNDLTNSAYYRNNVNNTNGLPVLGLDMHFDGLTTVIQASRTGLGAGIHHMTFAIADASDHILDSGVFIQAGSFSTTPTPPDVPEPATLLFMSLGLSAAGLSRRMRRSKQR